MSAVNSICAPLAETQWPTAVMADPQWYVVHTRSQHDKAVVNQLERRGIEAFLPVTNEVRRWSDRRKIIHLPLLSCYAFVHMRLLPELRYKVTQIRGVLGFVGARGEGTPIPDSQIENIRALLSSDVPYALCPFLQIGQRVRIRGGALDGIEGFLTARNGDRTLVISVEPIQRFRLQSELTNTRWKRT